jgi:hypothetical protein
MDNKTLPTLVKDITYFYIKHYYDKKINELNVNKLPNDDVIKFVNEMYHEKEVELKDYIKKTLKDTLGEKYPKLQVNMLLLEMFENPEFAKQRVINEIIVFQDNN